MPGQGLSSWAPVQARRAARLPRRSTVTALELLLVAAALGVVPQAGAAQQPETPPRAGLQVALHGQAADGWHRATQQIEVEITGDLPAGARSFGLMVGTLDVTAYARRAGDRLIYEPVVPLPAGETEVVVYVIRGDGGWDEIGRLPARVLTRSGLERAALEPRLEFLNENLIADGFSRGGGSPGSTDPNPSFNSGISGTLTRAGWSADLQAAALGVTERERALRFGELQARAPLFDLSSYRFEATRGPVTAALGHLSYGESRHLLSGFGSRGASTAVRLGQRGTFSAAVLNGSSVVGWSNFLGLSQSRHRMAAANLGVDLLPQSVGSARLDVTGLSGSLLPLGGFNRGVIDDAEESRGGSIQLAAGDNQQRVRLQAGYTMSRFTNPPDPFLDGDALVVAVRPVTRDARYIDMNIALLRGTRALGVPVSLSTAFRHEQVAPLFRSLGTGARADYRQDAVDFTAGLGQVQARFSHSRGRDNLDELRSVLKTLTRSSSANVALPLGALIPAAGLSAWLPAISYGLHRVHQFGAALPEEGAFAPSHVPDQMSTVHSATVDWQGARWRVGYSASRSLQDNRQAGREAADFETTTHNIAAGVNPWSALGLALSASEERSDNSERSETSRTRRLGLDVDLRATGTTTVSGGGSFQRFFALEGQRLGRGDEQRVELAQAFPTFGNRRGRLYVRFSRNSSSINDQVFGLDEARSDWRVQSGLTVGVF
jgi:hypothetical protein